jgi:hypothetical protein
MAAFIAFPAGREVKLPNPPSTGEWTNEPPLQATIGGHRGSKIDGIVELLARTRDRILQANGWKRRIPTLDCDLDLPPALPVLTSLTLD